MDILQNIFSYSENSPLLFTQTYFWLFFAFVMAIFSFLYKKQNSKILFLFIISVYFYYKSGGYFFTLLLFSTFVDYTLGWKIYRAKTQRGKKWYLFWSIFINLSILLYFKYAYFVTDIINQLFHTKYHVINYLGMVTNEITGSKFDVANIILPVGISFYTFQTISYSVDVYRNRVKPVNNIIDFGFYVTFFPQLVAGPIVRAADFVPQIYQKFKLTKEQFNWALFLIVNGLIKKVLISDYISMNFVDRVFDTPLSYTGFENLMAVYGYAMQIYCDFSGYTDIAIGVATLLGYHLPLNFLSPYKAENITDFWRRWHISLSSWLKDYLYIPLGGNRKGKARQYINLLITMFLGGLWHGASVRFIIWGSLHGIALAVHKYFKSLRKNKLVEKKVWHRFITVFITFHFVCFTWIFFRAESIQLVGDMLKQIFTAFHLELIPTIFTSYRIAFLLLFAAFLIHILPSKWKSGYQEIFYKLPQFVKLAGIVIIVVILYQAKSSGIQPFIYFQF